MTQQELEEKAKQKAKELLREYLHVVSGVPESLIFIFPKGDTHVETARNLAITCIYKKIELLNEVNSYSCDYPTNEYLLNKLQLLEETKKQVELL